MSKRKYRIEKVVTRGKTEYNAEKESEFQWAHERKKEDGHSDAIMWHILGTFPTLEAAQSYIDAYEKKRLEEDIIETEYIDYVPKTSK